MRIYAKVGEMFGALGKTRFKILVLPPSEWLMLVLAALTLFTTSCFLKYGFDFTDEAFYFNHIKWADTFSFGLTFFGQVYDLFRFFAGDSIHEIRVLNLILTYSISLCLALATARSRVAIPFSEVLAPSVAIALSSVFVFYPWLFTPNYNTLTFQGLVVTSLGVVSLARPQPANWRSTLPSALLVGVGGTLTFFGKPSSAAALAILVFITTLSYGKNRARTLALAGSTSLILIVIFAAKFNGGVYGFLEYLKSGLNFAAQLGGGHQLGQVLRFDSIPNFNGGQIATIAFAGLFIGYFYEFKKPYINLLATTLLLAFVGQHVGIVLISTNVEIVVTLFLASFVLGIFLIRFSNSDKGFGAKLSPNPLALYFFALPWVFTFGTNGNYWRGMAGATFFWLLIPVLPGDSTINRRQKSSISAGGIALILSIATLLLATQQPYRQPSIFGIHHILFQSRISGITAMVTNGINEELIQFDALLAEANFTKGTPVLDLSGKFPGLVFLAGAQPTAAAWVIGGYPGSAKAIETLIAGTNCNVLARSWVITQPKGDRSLPVDLVRSFGASPETDYDFVGSSDVQQIANSTTSQKINMLRPKNPQTILEKCRSLKDLD